MIIDADCHISSGKYEGLDITADELIDTMDQAEVDKALLRDFSAEAQAKVLGGSIERLLGLHAG
jgi:Tat protein secretion system quality control protein TatD with DNase activity